MSSTIHTLIPLIRCPYTNETPENRAKHQSFGPQLDPEIGVKPLGWHKSLDTVFRFHRRILVSPSRRRVWGRGPAFESLSPVVLSKSSRCSLCSQKTPSLRFAISAELTPRSVARTLREVDSPSADASAADCNTVDELFDICSQMFQVVVVVWRRFLPASVCS